MKKDIEMYAFVILLVLSLIISIISPEGPNDSSFWGGVFFFVGCCILISQLDKIKMYSEAGDRKKLMINMKYDIEYIHALKNKNTDIDSTKEKIKILIRKRYKKEGDVILLINRMIWIIDDIYKTNKDLKEWISDKELYNLTSDLI